MKILHAIVKDENVNTIVPVGGGRYESGEWDISEATAKALTKDGVIMLHAGQKEPSRHGGVVDGYRSRFVVKANGERVTLYTMSYTFDGAYMGVCHEGGWSQQIAIEDT